MEKKTVFDIVKEFDSSEFRKNSIPMGYAQGWPAVRIYNGTMLLTVPYFRRQIEKERAALYPIYCSVTFPLSNPTHIMDYTVYPLQKDWYDVDYKNPAGYFEMKNNAVFENSADYRNQCAKLYGLYSQFCLSAQKKEPFVNYAQMAELMQKLLEPALRPYYLRINSGFYKHFIG